MWAERRWRFDIRVKAKRLLLPMDLILDVLDRHFLSSHIYPTSWETDYIVRQALSIQLVLFLSISVLYLGTAGLNFLFLYDKRLMEHPLFLENQVRREIRCALSAIPLMSFLYTLLMLAEVRGYSRLYLDSTAVSLAENLTLLLLSAVGMVCFTDTLVYWVHRWLHHKLIYGHIHKTHHSWKVPTPFASHAFHPLDGFLTGLAYHIFPFLFPIHKVLYLVMLLVSNVWTISSHDGYFGVPRVFRAIINSSAHHWDHHLYSNYNYGQFLTLWDRLAGTYRMPKVYEKDEADRL